jgi:hypothetical protein
MEFIAIESRLLLPFPGKIWGEDGADRWGTPVSGERERGRWVGFLPGLARLVWAPGAAQVGWPLPYLFFVLFYFSFVLLFF